MKAKNQKLLLESLHTHTKDSDGDLTHIEVLEEAEKQGFGIVAFTEHDSLPSAKTLKLLQEYQGPVNWHIGIELTSKAPAEYHRAGRFHLLGYFTNPQNKALAAHCQNIAASRIERMKHFVKNLTAIGLKLTEQDCLDAAAGAPVGSPHILKAVYKYPENEVVIQKLRDQMRERAKTDPALALRYKEMLGDRPNLHPYYLFMKKSSLISMPPAKDDALVDYDASAQLIRDSGGMPIMAHWFYDRDVVRESELEELLKTKRMDGVEVDIINTISQGDHTAESIWLDQIAKRYDALGLVSADLHHAADFERFAGSSLAERSVGQTARIIERLQPSLEWTNFEHKTL